MAENHRSIRKILITGVLALVAIGAVAALAVSFIDATSSPGDDMLNDLEEFQQDRGN